MTEVLRPQVSIDGLSCVGKSTTARMLASNIGYNYLSAGEFYRSFAARLLDLKISEREIFLEALGEMSIELDPNNSHVIVDGYDYYAQLRSDETTLMARELSRNEDILRLGLDIMKKSIGDRVVMDGRNVGVEVLPHAMHKFVLTADLKVRALRKAAETGNGDIMSVRQELEENDKVERNRSVSPFIEPVDANFIDTTGVKPHEVVDVIREAIQRNLS